MTVLKRAAAVFLAASIAVSAVGCSGTDKSWAAKYGSETVQIGSYITYLYKAYSDAGSKVADASKKVLDQKVDNKDAATWIREKALTDTKMQLLTDKKMKDMNLTLTSAEKSSESSTAQNLWNTYSADFEKFGIAQSSFAAVTETDFKQQKIFEAIYGKGGAKAISDSDLKDFYVKNYTNFSLMACMLYTTDANGAYKGNLSDTDKKKDEKRFDDYADQIRSGKSTIQQTADDYKKLENSKSDELSTKTVDLATASDYPEALKKALTAMKAGEVKTMELTDQGIYVLVMKNDIAKTADDDLKTDSGRLSILRDYKGQEFQTEMEKEADAMTGSITVNDAAINSYDPKMFQS